MGERKQNKLTQEQFYRLCKTAEDFAKEIGECATYEDVAALLYCHGSQEKTIDHKQAKRVMEAVGLSLKAKEPPSLEARVKELEDRLGRMSRQGGRDLGEIDAKIAALEANLEAKGRELAQLRAQQNARPAVIFPPVRGSTPDSIPIQDRHDAIM